MADAECKMDELVKGLNSGKITPEVALQVVDQPKGKAKASGHMDTPSAAAVG